jgi:hypothetical protein
MQALTRQEAEIYITIVEVHLQHEIPPPNRY